MLNVEVMIAFGATKAKVTSLGRISLLVKVPIQVGSPSKVTFALGKERKF